MGGVNKVELEIIDWLKTERDRDSGLWPYLKELADGNESEWGDGELGELLSQLLDSSHQMHADIMLAEMSVDLRAARTLRRELSALYDEPDGWLEYFDARVIRVLLMQIHRDDVLYVHPRAEGFDPASRYRVLDADFVQEPGSTERLALPAGDRLVCDEPVSAPCGCLDATGLGQ